jgi:outer membrane receptor for ferric coprogen and ferric-rhodotorulic acid
VTLNQLISQEWSLGARYRISEAEFGRRFVEIPATTPGVAAQNLNVSATLHQVDLFAIYNHPSGFFSQFNTVWYRQSNSGYSGQLDNDDFWQFNVFAGWRFLRRQAEVRVGLLNIFDRDYRLNPVNLYSELPRERTLTASLRFYF